MECFKYGGECNCKLADPEVRNRVLRELIASTSGEPYDDAVDAYAIAKMAACKGTAPASINKKPSTIWQGVLGLRI